MVFSPVPLWVWSSMDLRKRRLTALTVTQSGLWTWSPPGLVPPKKDAPPTWTSSIQPAATAARTSSDSVFTSAPRCWCEGSVARAPPRDQSSPALWSRVLLRRSRTRLLTQDSVQRLLTCSSAAEWTKVSFWLCKQKQAADVTLEAVSTSIRSSRRQKVVPHCLLSRDDSSLGKYFRHRAHKLESNSRKSFPKSSEERNTSSRLSIQTK